MRYRWGTHQFHDIFSCFKPKKFSTPHRPRGESPYAHAFFSKPRSTRPRPWYSPAVLDRVLTVCRGRDDDTQRNFECHMTDTSCLDEGSPHAGFRIFRGLSSKPSLLSRRRDRERRSRSSGELRLPGLPALVDDAFLDLVHLVVDVPHRVDRD